MIRSLGNLTPQIHPDAYVSEEAYVVGDVEIGPGSSVWPGAVIRADSGKITIGRNTCVQDNSVIHADEPATIGDNVVIGHLVLCHATRIGDGAVLANGAMVNNGARIGDNCIVASGAVVLENADIPARSMLMGVPAQARGEVTDAHIARFQETADNYAERARRYRASGL